MMNTKTYDEMLQLNTFEDRLEYLYIGEQVGVRTFGSARYLNQRFYRSARWKRTRRDIILRDDGCDLAMDGMELSNRNIIIHHINPITEQDILEDNACLYDPNNLVSVSLDSHNRIHYGVTRNEVPLVLERTPNDMCPWKR